MFYQTESTDVKRLLIIVVWLFLYCGMGVVLHYEIDSAWGDRHPSFSHGVTITYLVFFALQGLAISIFVGYFIYVHHQRKKYSYLIDQLEPGSSDFDI